jgi:glutamine---fructose-6-phosphate transaminase (isomerizing)
LKEPPLIFRTFQKAFGGTVPARRGQSPNMCGIFGYIGDDTESLQRTLKGLKELEYRGYDSWGVCAQTPKKLFYKKGVGKISDIPDDTFEKIDSTVALGHTRWATHGKVSRTNSHPHFNQDKSIAVVHNGILENFRDLKIELEGLYGRKIIKTETDTEVIPHLIDMYMKRGFSFEEAFKETSRQIKGRFAYAVLHKDFPFILVARNGSPLVIGTGNSEFFIASDISAFLDYTDRAYFLNDGESAKVSREEISFHNFIHNKSIKKSHIKVKWTKEMATKGGWKHFMLKEIMEQKETITQTLKQEETLLQSIILHFSNAQNIFLSACGTAGHVCMIAEYMFAEYASIKLHFAHSAEFHKYFPFINNKSVLTAVSQSGETADLLEVVTEAKKRKGAVISILNVRGSTLERESLHTLPINAGPEKAVASTKAATSQLVAFALLAYILSGKYPIFGTKELYNEANEISQWLNAQFLNYVKKVAKRIAKKKDIYLIGKSILYPVALEVALKIKEVSYIHAEGFSSGELKHGPIALIEKGTPCVVHVGNDKWTNEVLGSAEELRARGAFIIGISTKKHYVFDIWIPVPDIEIMAPIAHIIVGQILAYYLAVLLGHDPDKPRNLAKSVTVK